MTSVHRWRRGSELPEKREYPDIAWILERFNVNNVPKSMMLCRKTSDLENLIRL
jgi:hypothetical protein